MKNRSLLINILIGISLLSLPILTSPDLGSNTSLLQVEGFKKSFLAYFLLLVFFYFHYYLIIPKVYSQKKWWLYVLILVFSFGVIWLLPSLAFSNGNFLETSGNPSNFPNFDRPPLPGPEPRHGPEPVFDLFRFRESFLFQFLMIVILSLMLKLNDRLKAMKSEKLKSEVSYLKAQINPHFLFNTLNSIYALTLIKSDKAPNAVLKLSDMMRYVVTESDTEKVPLEKELQYISDYIELQKLRIGDQVNFTFKVDGDPKSKTIVPIILINYIENAFKYGVNPDKPSKIIILIFIDSQGIRMTVENDIVVNDFMTGENTGEGSKNTAKRLDFHYPNKYHLDISQVNGIYKTTLYINLT